MHLVVTEKTIDFVPNGIIVEGEPLLEKFTNYYFQKQNQKTVFSNSVIVEDELLVERIGYEFKFSLIIALLFIDEAIFDDQGMIYDDFRITERRVMKKNNDCRKTW